MPLRRLLGEKDIMTDLRRVRTGAGAGVGPVAAHDLLGSRHVDTETDHSSEGALILGDGISRWTVLLHPDAMGHALVTGPATFTWSVTPTWRGRHRWNDGAERAYVDEDGESVFRRTRSELQASHTAMGESHGLGGTTYVAPCAGLRTELAV